jgi:SNF2 family DNA or RNA helicase
MIEITEEDYLKPPYSYQKDGIVHIFNEYHKVKRPPGSENFSALFDDMGVGKTYQAVTAASIAFQMDKIDMAIVVCPKSVRSQWDGEENGEIKKYCASEYISVRYDSDFIGSFPVNKDQLLWVTVSYSYLRSKLLQFLFLVQKSKKRFILILDESSFVKSHSTQQTHACKELRKLASMCIILNGTPIANTILDLWSQFDILDPVAIDYMSYYHFRARYCIQGGFKGKQYEDFHQRDLDKLNEELSALKELNLKFPNNETTIQKIQSKQLKIETMERIRDSIAKLKVKLKPWIIRRTKKDVLKELPPKLSPVYLEAPMSVEGYRIYTEMRDEMVAWANTAEFSEASNGAVKLGRLSQITSGYLGGLITIPVIDYYNNGNVDDCVHDEELTALDKYESSLHPENNACGAPKEIDRSKLDTFLEWYKINFELKVIVWCRFRAEMFRLKDELNKLGAKSGLIIGKQSTKEREETIRAASNGELGVVIANPASGGYGIDGLQNHFYTSVRMSMDHSLIKYEQSNDRLDRIGQTMPISYINILATSPRGGKTVDHLIMDSVINKHEMSKWSMNQWREKVRDL